MKCLICDGKTTVLELRSSKSFGERRRRKCLECDFRFSTMEIPFDTLRRKNDYKLKSS
ncbi:NrdR family transcriptional regulator [Planktothrix agardhii]|uniref:NrdR family transcriptional regulator n=1 Tax=Planktothrix agardhii TaxID=1160 RepID=UPI003F6E3FAB